MTETTSTHSEKVIPLPPAAIELCDFGFIGREREIHALHAALQAQSQAGLLVYGMSGIGKTTLIQGYLYWRQQKGALKANIFWFRFDEIRSFEYVVNQMVEGLFGTNVLVSPLQQKLDNLCQVFLQNPFILVWDSFESAGGTSYTDVMPLLSEEDRCQFKTFLQRLQNGKSKVIITSRSPEDWLAETECNRMPLSGLQGDDCRQYCLAVASHFDIALDEEDAAYCDLMDELNGHPLAMRVVLLKLDETPVEILLQEFEQDFYDAASDEVVSYFDATLGLLETSFPPEYTAVLQFIGLHQRYVQLNTLVDMMRNSDLVTGRIIIQGCITVLEHVGLVRPQKKDIYTLHPALSGYLRRQHPAETAVIGAFVDLMGHFADHLAPKEFNEQRAPFYIHSANFHCALYLAKTLNMEGHITALTQSLAVFAQNDRDYEGAARLFESLSGHYSQLNDDSGLASCYHQLGRIAQERHDFNQSEQWYRRSLGIKEAQGDKHGMANTYAQLGTLKRLQQHWVSAAKWFVKAANTFNDAGDMQSVARVADSYMALLQQSDTQVQEEIRQLWQQPDLS